MKRDNLPAPITFGSVCSGIEAFSVAVAGRPWEAAWLAEIEPTPCKILHYHYGSGRPVNMPSPDDEGLSDDDRDARRTNIKAVASLPVELAAGAPPNYGDFTLIAAQVRAGQAAAPDVLVGGTPCQAFSIAGLRNSLGDARGQLTLSFVDLANAIDSARLVRGLPAAAILWENVPGVLSTKDNAFGCFLGALAGEDCPLVAPGGKWPNAGCVFGPQRAIAWRVTDAQYFGVAQRRRRVFVVASARNGFDPTEILFEFDGLRRDIAPSRQAGQGVAAGTLRSTYGGSDVDHALAGQLQPVGVDGGVICMAHGQGGAEVAREAPIVAGMVAAVDICPTLRAGGNQTGGDRPPGTDVDTADSLIFGMALSVSLRGRDGGATAGLGDEIAGCLRASGGGGDKAHVLAPIAFDSRQDCVSSASVFGALGSSSPQAQAVSYAIQAGALRTNPNSGPDGVGVQAHIAYTLEARAEVQAACITGDITHTLKAEGFDASEDGTGRGQPIVAMREAGQGYWVETVVSDTLRTDSNRSGKEGTILGHGMAVRRLTPRECERLQAFPDFYTLIPMGIVKASRAEDMLAKGDPVACIDGVWWKLSADGPRYKALGNSMCVLNIRWIAARIEAAIFANFAHEREIARFA